MNYHVPKVGGPKEEVLPTFMQRANELISPQAVYRQAEYPKLPCDMVKIISQDGRSIFLPLSKLNQEFN